MFLLSQSTAASESLSCFSASQLASCVTDASVKPAENIVSFFWWQRRGCCRTVALAKSHADVQMVTEHVNAVVAGRGTGDVMHVTTHQLDVRDGTLG